SPFLKGACGASMLAYFDDVVVEDAFDFLEPMRDACGNDNHISLDEFAGLPIPNGRAPYLVGSDGPAFYHRTARDERTGSLGDVDEIGVQRMDFRHARLFA